MWLVAPSGIANGHLAQFRWPIARPYRLWAPKGYLAPSSMRLPTRTIDLERCPFFVELEGVGVGMHVGVVAWVKLAQRYEIEADNLTLPSQ